MADNFNLRLFLSENKLTKNAKLIKENSYGFDTLMDTVADFFPEGTTEYEKLADAVADALDNGQIDTSDFNHSPSAPSKEVAAIAREIGLLEAKKEYSIEEASYKAPKNSKEAQHLRKGDIIGSGDEVVSVSAGAKTPAGKVEVTLKTKNGSTKTSLWGKTTKIGLKKVEESKLTAKERALVEMVQDALREDTDDMENDRPNDDAYAKAFDTMEEGDEMVQENPLPKYKNIDELMSNIEQGTNEAAHKYKMNRMKEVAEALEAKVGSLEEGENAEHIDQKVVKQMRKDILALRKAEEKLRKEFEKKFASKKETKQDK